MNAPTPEAAAAISRARLAAALVVADAPETLRWSARERSRTGKLAAASAIAHALAWPVSRAARLTGADADHVWDARCDGDPVFVAAEREARAALVEALGTGAPQTSDRAVDLGPAPDDRQVVRLRPLSEAVIAWSRAYLRRGVPIDDLADLFSVSHETLAAAVENKQ